MTHSFSGEFFCNKKISKQDAFFIKKQSFPSNLPFEFFFILTCHTDWDLMTDSIYVEYLLFPCLVVYLGVLVNLQQ